LPGQFRQRIKKSLAPLDHNVIDVAQRDADEIRLKRGDRFRHRLWVGLKIEPARFVTGGAKRRLQAGQTQWKYRIGIFALVDAD
jgi:hypothetical protein